MCADETHIEGDLIVNGENILRELRELRKIVKDLKKKKRNTYSFTVDDSHDNRGYGSN